MALAVVLACESLLASWPLALERPFFIVRSQMSLQIEVPSEGTAASWNGTNKRRLLLPPFMTRIRRPSSCHIRLRNSDG